MKHKIVLFLTLISTATFAIDINSIMEKAHLASYYQKDDGTAQLLMKVYPKGDGKATKKLFYMLRKDIKDGGEQLFYTYFVKPSDIKNTTFLVHKKIKEDDYRRLYIPASDKVLAISGARKQDPFMGSDFSYEDVSGRHFSKDNHKLLKENKFDGKEVYVTESIPKDKADNNSKIVAWIQKSNFLPLKVEYYNRSGVLYKRYESKNIKIISGVPTILKRVMTSLLDGTKTILLVNPKKIKYNVGLQERDFSERSLKKPPMKYLK